MKELIIKKFKVIVKESNIRVLFAVESGCSFDGVWTDVLGILGMLLLIFSIALFALRLTGMNMGVKDVLMLFLQGMAEGLGETQEMRNEEKKRLDARIHAIRNRSKEIKDLNDYISGKKQICTEKKLNGYIKICKFERYKNASPQYQLPL
ncbi:MAG: hypothetical protein K6F76_04195 [Clostridiales bacterium]|nr:hypothetical protein [Clostridiales bacterium]